MATSKLFSQFRVLYNLMVLRKNKIQLNNIRNLTNYAFRNSNLTPDFFEKLCLSVGQEKLNTSLGIRKQYGTDESSYESLPPDIVANPDCVDDICKVTKLCSEYCAPIIPHGSGTGVEQGIAAVMGGVSVDLALLNSMIELNVGDFDCTVEAGITRKTLNSHLKNTGLMFPVDPAADASIGGMVSTSASGTNAVRYGTMKENVLNLEVVLADGSILHTAGLNGRARKSSAGYNLTELFTGSEGTLGIITKATLKLHAVPEVMISAVSSFKSVHDAVSAVVEILQNSIPVARIELLDELSMIASKKYSNLDCPISPCLFLEFHGSKDVVKAQAKQVEDIVKNTYNSNFIWAEDPESRNALWHARYQIYHATLALKPGYKGSKCTGANRNDVPVREIVTNIVPVRESMENIVLCIGTDVCVPISKLTEMIIKTQQDIKDAKVLGTIVGHVGDGNFHTQLLFDPENKEDIKAVYSLADKITMRALSLNGTCTGEHGIGLSKISHLENEYGKVGIEAMKSIKKAFDPLNIMNPGKVIRI